MFRSRFFWRLYATYSLLVLLTTAGIGFLIQRQIVESVEQDIETRLFAQAAALSALGAEPFGGGDADGIQRIADEVGAETAARITFIRADGVVLADSQEDPARMENHADRPEIVQAHQTGRGSSRRFSATAQRFLLYAARAVETDGDVAGVVRVAIPLEDVAARLVAVRRVVYTGAGVGIVLALGLGLAVARRFTAPVTEMSRVSERLRGGDYAVRVDVKGTDELRTLGENLNRLADELTRRIANLTQQGAQLNAIIRSMQEGVVAVGADDSVALANASARALLDIDETELSLHEMRSRHPVLAELIDEARATNGPARRALMSGVDDDARQLDAYANLFDTDGEPGVLVVLHDTTALRRLERIRTDFVANVSHELKTPLTSIQGYVETLLDGAVNDPDYNVRFLSKIEQHVLRLSALVTDLLSLARIETPEASLKPTPLDWREIVLECLARRRDVIARKPLTLAVDLGDEPILMLGEPEGARQVVDNLLDNAINYTPEEGALTVRAGAENGRGFVQIADTGIGIPEHLLDRIFERFYRVDRGRSRGLGGTGLGLSIVRNIVQRLGGSIEVESEVGIGTSVTVRIPGGSPS